jgi:hypothetical protein
MQVVHGDHVYTFAYPLTARFKQLWRIPATFVAFSGAALYAYEIQSKIGVILSCGVIVCLVPQTLWIASWHPNLKVDRTGISAWRFGICLQRTEWTTVTEIKKQYRRISNSALTLRCGTTKRLDTDGKYWKIEIGVRQKRFFTISFSNRIMEAEKLLSVLNAKIQEFDIPVTTSASKRP